MNTKTRPGFTLVEMLVAVGLVLFLMVLMSQAFVAALESFRILKGLGDMDERLRIASTALRKDLSSEHFEGSKKLSDNNFFRQGPPKQGFFRIWHGSPMLDHNQQNGVSSVNLPNGSGGFIVRQVANPQNTWEGVDGEGFRVGRATDHILHMAVRYKGSQSHDYLATSIAAALPPAFTALAPSPLATFGRPDGRYQTGGLYTSQWAEVAYYLRPNGDSTGGVPLYNLYRRQLLTVPEADQSQINPNINKDNNNNQAYAANVLLTPTANAGYAEVSCREDPQNPGILRANTPTDLTIPERRFGTFGARDNQNQGRDRGLPASGAGANLAVNPIVVPSYHYPHFGEAHYRWSNGGGGTQNNGVYAYPNLQGADVLLADVISFSIRILTPSSRQRSAALGTDAFVDLFDSEALSRGVAPDSTLQSANPRYSGPVGPRVFDTWSSKDDHFDYSRWNDPSVPEAQIPLRLRILAIEITIRIFDRKTQQTRQVTIIQDA